MTLIDDSGTVYQAGSRQTALIALQIFLVSMALLVYSLRVYTRAVILRSLARDDYIMGLAMLISVGIAINSCVGTKYGWGLHASAILPENLSGILLTIWISELLFTFSTSLVKLSILFFYLRLAVTPTYRRVIYASIAFIAVWAVTFSFIVIFQCHPVSSYWHPTESKCLPATTALFIHGLTNTFTDIYVYILPMRLVWGINLPKRQRIGLLVIFGFGFLVCVAGAFRLYYAVKAQNSSDSTWQGFDVWTWESVEVNLGIVCASAPCLKSLVTRILPRIMGDSTQSKSGTFPSAAARGNPGWGSRAIAVQRWVSSADVEAGRGMKMGTVVTIGSGASSSETLRKPGMAVIKERSESQDGLKDSVDAWK